MPSWADGGREDNGKEGIDSSRTGTRLPPQGKSWQSAPLAENGERESLVGLTPSCGGTGPHGGRGGSPANAPRAA
ncbi:MAG TPA: hypothetical protein IAD28_06980 [Candidatus Faeciplasma avium]|uniref:Uncharacterized protein n=1 Tax=Candidatus Faeciplasma avium TaxID=2840798 RepID=A0A9D1NRC9_9FIRM|nr:hypothetical protein [Candidatus Faeciplasma avium]